MQLSDKGAAIFYERFRLLRDRQHAWSKATFGDRDVRHGVGPLKHLAKEVLCELLGHDHEWFKAVMPQDAPMDNVNPDRSEWADVLILLLDALWREGIPFGELVEAALVKMEENERRDWPPLEAQVPGQPVEHRKGDGVRLVDPMVARSAPDFDLTFDEGFGTANEQRAVREHFQKTGLLIWGWNYCSKCQRVYYHDAASGLGGHFCKETS